MHPIFFPSMVFDCRHNIWNQTVFTAIPSLNLFHNITVTRTHQHLGKILKDIFFGFFFFFFKAEWHLGGHCTQANNILSPLSIDFHSSTQELNYIYCIVLFIINLRILSFSQVRFSLRLIQVFKRLGHPKHLLTPPTNNTAIFLPTLIDKESAYLESLSDIIFKV